MATLNSAWRRGALVGLIIGTGVSAAAWSNVFTSGSAVMQFLVAAPPFLLDVLLNAPEALQALVVVVWWGLAGTAIGWGLGRKEGGKIIAILVAAVLVFAHVRTQASIEQDVSTAAQAVEGMLRTLFGI